MFKKVIYNTASQIVGKIISASSTLLVTVIIAKALGEAGYGDLTKIFVFVGYFYILADFGLNSIYVKTAKTKDKEQSFLKVLVGTRLLLSLTLAFVAIAVGFLTPYDPLSKTGFSPLVKTGIAIYSLTIITQSLYTSANAFFQKNLRYDLSTIAVIFGSATILTGALTAYQFNGSILSYVSIYIFSGIVTLCVATFFIFKKLKKFPLPTFDFNKMLIMLKGAWPIGTSLVLNLIYFRIDVFILANVRPSSEVGIYGLAYQFFESSLAIPIFFSNALYPWLIKIYEQDLKAFKNQLIQWLKILTAVAILLTLLLFIIAQLIPLIYNGQFQGSVKALQILALGMPFFFASALLWHCLIILDRQKLLILIYLSGAVFNLLANLIFIPLFGFLSAAVITTLSEALVLALLTIACLKSYNQQLNTNNYQSVINNER